MTILNGMSFINCSTTAKETKIVFYLFHSRQSYLFSRVLDLQLFRCSTRSNKDKTLLFSSLFRVNTISDYSNVVNYLRPINGDFLELGTERKDDLVILNIFHHELENLCKDGRDLMTRLDELRTSALLPNLNYINVFMYTDQCNDESLLTECFMGSNFVFDFRPKDIDKKKLVDLYNNKHPNIRSIFQKSTFEFTHSIIRFLKYVPKNHVVEDKNPDDVFATTFKLGVNEEVKRERDALVLPFHKHSEVQGVVEKSVLSKQELEELKRNYLYDSELDEEDSQDV